MDLYFIRHVESEANLSPEIISGRSNHVDITALGMLQGPALGRRWVNEKIMFDGFYASPAVRTDKTAELSLFPEDYKRIIYRDALQEIDQGKWTGQNRKDVYTLATRQEMEKDPWNFAAPDGESQKDVATRTINFLEQEVLQNYDKNAKIFISAHGGTIRYTLAELLGMNKQIAWKIAIDNASITQVRYESGEFWPIRINDASHIYGLKIAA